jgi:hypothetical protein
VAAAGNSSPLHGEWLPVLQVGAWRSGQAFRRCLADYDLVAGAYEKLAADYDWMSRRTI